MAHLRLTLLVGIGLALGSGLDARGATTPMDYQEVFQLLKANLTGATDGSLNEAAARGLIAELSPRVTLIESGTSDAGAMGSVGVSSGIFDRNFGYLRVQKLDTGTAKEVNVQVGGLRSTNTLKGLVIDLRYASGEDYSAAVAIADRFISSDATLVDWGEGWKRSTAKTNAIAIPVAILVNRRTSGAAEALAGILRYRDVGLLIGTNTSGQASMAKIFTLKTGQRLRIAIAPLKVADGRELPFTGIRADLGISVSAEDELGYYEDAFKVIAKGTRGTASVTNELHASTTNRAPRRRMNEAELVRMSREGQVIDRDTSSTSPTPPIPEPSIPQVTDPALARALDLLKGLAVVQQFRSN